MKIDVLKDIEIVKDTHTCSICKLPYVGTGNNAEPVNNGRCCNGCDKRVVLPARLNMVCRKVTKKGN